MVARLMLSLVAGLLSVAVAAAEIISVALRAPNFAASRKVSGTNFAGTTMIR